MLGRILRQGAKVFRKKAARASTLSTPVVEVLEPRILLSATWVEADTGDAPREAVGNGSNVSWGGVFYFETEFLDIDGDGHLDIDDNCPLVSNPDQLNDDPGRYGDACDDDDDGMPDVWEDQYLEYNGGPGLSPLVDDANDDLDGDGVSNIDEYNAGTDPQNSDTDSDGMLDGWELG